jgi:hypothetical protein
MTAQPSPGAGATTSLSASTSSGNAQSKEARCSSCKKCKRENEFTTKKNGKLESTCLSCKNRKTAQRKASSVIDSTPTSPWEGLEESIRINFAADAPNEVKCRVGLRPILIRHFAGEELEGRWDAYMQVIKGLVEDVTEYRFT